jgi:hypothetical protein
VVPQERLLYTDFSLKTSPYPLFEVIAGALIAALTVGGKALAKNVGINNSNYIVYRVGVFLSYFSAKVKRTKR